VNGRTTTHPIPAPAGYHHFTILDAAIHGVQLKKKIQLFLIQFIQIRHPL
jgi:hypothetical protein